jgi:toxin ParE1/3/4
MLRVIILPAAEQDIVDLGRSLLERAGRITSDAMVERIFTKIELLGEFPRIGMPRDDFRPGTRVSAARPYLIFHTIANDTVIVLRVLHGARDIKPEMLP